jgi:hypothetical protein
MAKDWSYGALDDMYLSGQLKRAAEPRFQEIVPRRELRVGLAGLCLLAGVMTALLYVWPVLFVTQVVNDGMRTEIFWPVLAGGAAVASLVTWAITTREQRHWAEHWQDVGDWADPPPWK